MYKCYSEVNFIACGQLKVEVHAGDVFTASNALSPAQFEQPQWVQMYGSVVHSALTFGGAIIVLNCIVSILIDVYRCVLHTIVITVQECVVTQPFPSVC